MAVSFCVAVVKVSSIAVSVSACVSMAFTKDTMSFSIAKFAGTIFSAALRSVIPMFVVIVVIVGVVSTT